MVNHTHPEYGASLATFLQRSHANAILLRGTEGEPVADPRRLPRMDVFLQGELRADLSIAAQEGVLDDARFRDQVAALQTFVKGEAQELIA